MVHPRSPYAVGRPDFAALAARYPDFGAHVTTAGGHATIDWGDPNALIALCRVLLCHDFGVEWSLPRHALCPTVPSRLNYLLWIEDLVIGRDPQSPPPSEQPIVGIDIGTGASCIYPLLGVAHLGWRFIATEVDEESVAAARKNVALNAWAGRIDVRHVPVAAAAAAASVAEDGAVDARSLPRPILVGVLHATERASFCMCNPPFFDLDETPRPNLSTRPHARCEATRSEQFTAGGEVGFVLRLIGDSLALRERVVWYTSLVGRKRSLVPILRALREAGAVHVRTTEIAQGQTWRWAVGWSFVPGAAPLLAPPPRASAHEFGAEQVDAAEAQRRALDSLRSASSEWTVSLRPQEEEEDDDEKEDEGGGDGGGERPKYTLSGHAELALTARAAASAEAGASEPKRSRRGGHQTATGTAECASSAPAPAGATGPCAFSFRVEVYDRRPGCAADDGREAASATAGCWLRAVLEACTPGVAHAAFWRFAGQLRNDVVRDTRKWRRKQTGGYGNDHGNARGREIM